MPSSNLLLFAIIFEGGLGLLAWLLSWLLGRPLGQFVHWEWAPGLWGAAATLPMLLVLVWITRYPAEPFVRLKQVVEQLVAELFDKASLGQILMVSLLAGLGEEMMFRGLIQGWLADQYGTAVGLVLASTLFGLAHPVTKTYAVLAGLIGLYFGWLWIRFDNLLVPIVTHALYDFLALLYLVRYEAMRR